MPTRPASVLLIPKDDDEFENMILELYEELWNSKNLDRNGRSGQRQNGVDIFGIPEGQTEYSGIQCKRVVKLTEKQVDDEIEKANPDVFHLLLQIGDHILEEAWL